MLVDVPLLVDKQWDISNLSPSFFLKFLKIKNRGKEMMHGKSAYTVNRRPVNRQLTVLHSDYTTPENNRELDVRNVHVKL